MNRISAFTALASLLLLIITSACVKSYRKAEGMVWHTSYHVTYESDRDLSDSILAAFNTVGQSLNVFDSTSLVSKVNNGDSIPVDGHFATVYEMARRVNRISDGAFDPTLGPLIDAWGFGKGHKATADTLRIDSLLNITGIARTKIENGTLIKEDRRISFNFSAIAKGYGCDMVAEMFERNGVSNYLVEIGGEIRCGGKSPSGNKWRVSIDRPIRSDSIRHDSQCIVEISGCGLATSGNYRNFSTDGAPGTGHTISVTTGRPVVTDILSASVIAPTTMEADALATAMMALRSARAKKLAENLGYPTLLVLADSTVWQHLLPISPEDAEP
ncbi:MAG: FAD:protein FMN transferase [Muribaculaceae bacterium]|nr:FAD:protein FMN transferase [Muribaculaceae bacterium]